MIEFDCEGCGTHIVDLGSVEVPASRQCQTCRFLCENVLDPDEFWSAYQRLVGRWRSLAATMARRGS